MSTQTLTENDSLVAPRWRVTIIACAVVFLALLALFHDTALGMVDIWYNFETYTHGFIILPISLWLIWQKREHLAAFTPQPTPYFLILVMGGLAVWVLARLTGVQVVEQLAFVGLIIASLAVLLGWQVAKFLAFPLLFLLFAVPMGEDLVPPMMEFTATFTVAALKLTGIPVYRDGLWFSLPTGSWSVVEACSGVRYLIASVTLGVMYAYITYHTLWKRLLFIAMSALVPILANGLRAYMIVMIGHLSEMEYATGVDHLIYGWFFFGIVMFILFWVGAIWQEDQAPPQFVAPPRQMTSETVGFRVMMLSVVILAASVLTVWATSHAEDISVQMEGALEAPTEGGTWSKLDEPVLWPIAHQDTAYKLAERYGSGPDKVQLYVVLFPHQRQGSEAINSANAIAEDPERIKSLGSPTVMLGDEPVQVNQSKVTLKIDGVLHEHLVWQWYRVAGRSLTNRYEGKAWEALSRIYPGRADGAWIAISTPYESTNAKVSQQRLVDFALEIIPLVDGAIDTALGITD